MAAKKKSKFKTLDLHGFRADEVIDALDRFIHQNQNQRRLCILTGKGTGTVKKIVIDYLKLAGYPWEYENAANGKPNQGSLIILMD